MPYTPRSRDRFKSVVALLTGAATFTTVAATGVVTGLAARQTGLRDQQRAEEQARLRASGSHAPRDVVVTVARPTRTVVHTTVVHRTSRSGVAAVGPGGTLSSTAPVAAGTRQSTSPTVRPAPVAVPPPAPAPAPSTGS